MNSIDVSKVDFQWIPVTTVTGTCYKFPMPAKSLGKLRDGPAVYRWSVSPEVDGQSMIYVGETSSLRRRVNNYLKMHGPGQKTNVRLFEMFSNFVANNKEVTLDVLSFQKFTVSISTITEARLAQKWVRLLLEGLMVAHSIGPDCKVLNLSVDS